MAKTNFTKVEEALEEGLRKITVNKLLNETDQRTKKSKKSNSDALAILVASIRHEFNWFAKQDSYFILKLEVDKNHIKKLLKQTDPYTPEQIAELKILKAKIDEYRKEIAPKDPTSENEKMIELELKRQKTKRFNVRDKWLPLH